MKKNLVVGLTGAVGAGKTTVAELLARRGVRVINADRLAREVVTENAIVRRNLKKAFGSDIFSADGNLLPDVLAARAFATAEATAVLNNITHPPLIRRLKSELKKYKTEDIIVVDAALILEWAPRFGVDVLVVVKTPAAQRKARAKAKYGNTLPGREITQLPEKEKIARADIILKNDGTLKKLRAKVKVLHNLLMEIKRVGLATGGRPVVI